MLIAHAAQSAAPDEAGFVHAVGLAARGHARLTSVHACAAGSPPVELPHARTLLSRWGLADAEVVHERVQHDCCDAVDETLLDALGRLRPDLLVASTHARAGLSRLLFGSVAEGVARNFRGTTLLVPQGEPGLFDPDSGALRLERALVPVGGAHGAADAQWAVDALERFAQLSRVEALELLLLHVDDGTPVPAPAAPARFTVRVERAAGPLDRAVRDAAHALGADLIVMATHGHDGAGDVLFSSHTERVLHGCKRPLLWVPAAG
jgi:nucleotide-binding universal stress UspA family protein